MIEVAIVGAGPYGLSIASHFHSRGISFRVFGPPMLSWREHMPKGMMLKSDGFASNLYHPAGEFRLKQYCAEQGIPYTDDQSPVHLETFSAYGVAFRDRYVPELEEKFLAALVRTPEGFSLTLDTGEVVKAKRVVLAVGITHFGHIPSNLAHLSEEFVTHSYRHHDLTPFKNRSVAVIGAGASSIGLAGLLAEVGAKPELVARPLKLAFHSMPIVGHKRPLWQRIRNPKSGLGPGLRSRFFADYPNLFYYLPENRRIQEVRTALGPSGHWYSRDKVEDKLPLHLGFAPESATVEGSKVRLTMRAKDGSSRDILVDHIIAGTGYRVDMRRLEFLSPEILAGIRTAEGSPVLSPSLESSVPGLYFVGLAAANSFGPVMRFAFGAGFAAQNLTSTIGRSMSRGRSTVPSASLAATTK
jgi:cation diffusion facilitator CzcD-associated flavoprotein CzcO